MSATREPEEITATVPRGSRRLTAVAGAALVLFALLALAGAGPAEAKKKLFDFGDAPDKRGAALGNFPTTKKSKGLRVKNTKLKLGADADRERDAKQVNVDVGDDGIALDHVPCQEVTYLFRVNATDLPKRKRKGKAWLNLWLDWNLDGDWGDTDRRCGNTRATEVPEHRVQNQRVILRKFRKNPVQVVEVTRVAGGTALLTEELPFWVRASITTQKVKAPSDGRNRRPLKRGEVEDYGPEEPAGDWGDAPEGVTVAAPLCQHSATSPNFCDYTSSKDRFGPRHLNEKLLRLGPGVTSEKDANLHDADGGDDGFEVTRLRSCRGVTVEFSISAARLKRMKPGLASRVKRGDERIFLNFWFDVDNDGEWLGSQKCVNGGKEGPHRTRLFDGEQRQLIKNGSLQVKHTFTNPGQIDPGGIGCSRASLSLGQDYSDVALPSSFSASGIVADGRVAGPYEYGETEDICPGDLDEPPVTPKQPDCTNGKDDDGDELIDAADFGCLVGPGGTYDADDAGESDILNDQAACPSSAAETFIHSHKYLDKNTLVRHILELGGTPIVEKGQADGDFDDGSLAPFNVACTGGTTASASVDWTTTPGGEGTIPPILEYSVALEYVSGAGGTIVMQSAPNTRRASTTRGPGASREVARSRSGPGGG